MSTCTEARPSTRTARPSVARRRPRAQVPRLVPATAASARATTCRTPRVSAGRLTLVPPVVARRVRLRLTVRGRRLLVALLLTLLAGAFLAGTVSTSAAGTSAGLPAGAPAAAVTVAPGETLWQIAQRVAPARDPRPVVVEIRELNDLASASVQAGQQLLLPAAR